MSASSQSSRSWDRHHDVVDEQVRHAACDGTADSRDLHGQPKVHPEKKVEEDTVGVSTGMNYTPVGGDIMRVEWSVMEPKGMP